MSKVARAKIPKQLFIVGRVSVGDCPPSSKPRNSNRQASIRQARRALLSQSRDFYRHQIDEDGWDEALAASNSVLGPVVIALTAELQPGRTLADARALLIASEPNVCYRRRLKFLDDSRTLRSEQASR
jgi:hypothetical protein